VEKSRLKIPLLIGFDVLHGHRTTFPVPLAEAGIFDRAAWERSARESAKEAAADGISMVFAPMLDISRDPRWGRVVEGPGEDPWLAQEIARAKVRGFQGEDLSRSDSVAAVAKHYCGYGAVTAGRDYAATEVSERSLEEVHLPPFRAAVEVGVAAVMPAFTDVQGVPMTAHRILLQDVLRGRMKFDGVIVSDYNAIAELVRHGVAADLTEAAALALNAGVDIDMMSFAYRRGLPRALERGLVTQGQIDEAVGRVLTLKLRLGLFEDPYRRGATRDSESARLQRRRVARDLAARSVVMMKNDGDVLPLTARRIAVIGPLADAGPEMRGPWRAAAGPEGQVSLLTGLSAALPDASILFAPGVPITGGDIGGIEQALSACRAADAIILCLGESAAMSGEAASRADPSLPGHQQALADAVCGTARSQGKPVVVILFSGRPLIIAKLAEEAQAVLTAWFPGSEAGHALADILTGRVSPSGKVAMSWPRHSGQIPVFFGERPSGRPADLDSRYTSKYIDMPNSPLFAFGHGLTYGKFKISNLRLNKRNVGLTDTVEISAEIVNKGERAAEETLFVFVRPMVSRVTRPNLALKGFDKIVLGPGEKGTMRFSLRVADLTVFGADLQERLEPGEVEILVGPSADRAGLLTKTLTIVLD
jgi:beta-glucosidase